MDGGKQMRRETGIFRAAGVRYEEKIDLEKLRDAAADDERISRVRQDMMDQLALYGMPDWWASRTGAGITIALIDGGVDVQHPALKDAVDLARSMRIQDGVRDANIHDEQGHGTHCAGIIAARKVADTVPFHGVARGAKLIIYKVLDKEGKGKTSDVAAAVQEALNNRDVLIVSMSLVGAESDEVLYSAVHRLLAQGRICICAAGNLGQLREVNIGYPGRYGGVITVASHGKFGTPSAFSSSGGEIDMSGPGESVWSTMPGGGYAKLSGTSMAAPWVAGLAALILEKHVQQAAAGENGTPIRNTEDMREHLLRMAAHPGRHDPFNGYGPLWPGRLM